MCNSRCDSRGDCAAGALCRLDSRACAFVPSVCVDAFTVELADGSQSSCDGHRCSAGDCQERCGDDNDCAPDYLCFDRDCVPEAEVVPDAGVDAGPGPAPDAGAGDDASTAMPVPDAGAVADAGALADAATDAAAEPEPEADAAVASEPEPTIDEPVGADAGDDSGCGCRVPGTRRAPAPGGLGLGLCLLGLLAGRVRRRRVG
jgi:hypothetical protein